VIMLFIIKFNLIDFMKLPNNFEKYNRNTKNSALRLISDYCFIASVFIFDYQISSRLSTWSLCHRGIFCEC